MTTDICTLDNRRLAVFRLLAMVGNISLVKVSIVLKTTEEAEILGQVELCEILVKLKDDAFKSLVNENFFGGLGVEARVVLTDRLLRMVRYWESIDLPLLDALSSPIGNGREAASCNGKSRARGGSRVLASGALTRGDYRRGYRRGK